MARRFRALSSAVTAAAIAAILLLPVASAAKTAPLAAEAGAAATSPKESAKGAMPSGPVPVAAGAPRSGGNANAVAAEGGAEQYGSFGHMNFMVIGVLLALAAAVVIGLLIKRRREAKASQDSGEPAMGYNNLPPSRRSLIPDDHRDTVISDLLRRVQVMEQRITALENGGATRGLRPDEEPPQPQRYSGYPSGQHDNVYDRRREPQDLPEDNWSASNRPPPQGYNAEPPRAAHPNAASPQQFATDLAELFNRANKPDFDALASQYGAESYTNDRRGDLAQLIKDPNDRFWVVPIPGRPDLALMIPGFTVKKSWAKLRHPETDHPLAHHFDLRRGDRLQVIRPALLRRNSNNFWELHQKGEVVGIS